MGTPPGHRGREVVYTRELRQAAEIRPGPLQTLDHILEALPKQRPDEHVARVGHHQDQGVDGPLPAGVAIEDGTQFAEVQLHDLARIGIGHADGGLIAFGS